MAKQTSIKTNYFFSMLLSYLDVLFPLVTAPYISRVLGAENLGKVNFANSVMGCFLVAAAYGTTVYGVREVAKLKDDQKALNGLFSDLVRIKLAASAVFIFVYVFAVLNLRIFRADLVLYFILLPNLLINVINIDWFFQGIGNFKYITLRSGLMKVLCLILMFALVKSPTDYTRYAGIIVFGLAGTCVMNYLYSRKFVRLRFRTEGTNGCGEARAEDGKPWGSKIKTRGEILGRRGLFKRHRAIHIFFVSSLLATFYLYFDQILLFILADSTSVAFLNRAKIIITMVTALITALITVLLPKASSHYATDKPLVDALFKKALGFIYVSSIPCAVGLFAVAPEVMLLLGGEEFAAAAPILSALALTIPFTAVRMLLKNHYLIPGGHERFVLLSEGVALGVYVAVNWLLIPRLGLWGCVVAVAVYEGVAGGSAYVYCKEREEFRLGNKGLRNAVIGAVGILLAAFFVKSLGLHYIITLGLCVVAGGVVYGGVLMAIRDETAKEGIGVVKRGLRQ